MLLSDLLNLPPTSQSRPVREVTDPAYRISSNDSGWLLIWRGPGMAVWVLGSDAMKNTDVLTYRAGSDSLAFSPQVPGSMNCGFPGHNAVGYPLGFVQLFVDSNTGNQAFWVLAGATGTEVVP